MPASDTSSDLASADTASGGNRPRSGARLTQAGRVDILSDTWSRSRATSSMRLRWYGFRDLYAQRIDRRAEQRADSAHRSRGRCMWRRFLSSVSFGVASTVLACTPSSPVAPLPSPASQPSPFAAVAGRYVLTIEIDQSCRGIPPALRLRNYNVEVEDRGWHFAQSGA